MTNPYLALTRQFNDGRLRARVSSGHAVVLHRLAVMSKDGDSPWRPWGVDVCIEFRTERMAARFERYLKSGSGHTFATRHFSDS